MNLANATIIEEKIMGDKKTIITKQLQLSLFTEFTGQEPGKYSNTVDVYDALPKFITGQKEYDILDGAVNLMKNKEVVVNQQKFSVTVLPAVITTSNGNTKHIYPGERESIIEDVLRKFAANGQIIEINGLKGVQFTLNQVYQELIKNKRSLNLAEIKEAIKVMNLANITCTSSDSKKILASSFFPLIMLTDREEWQQDTDSKCFVQFNLLVSSSIDNLKFRQYDYLKNLKIKSPIARHLHKLLSHVWKQAGAEAPYRFSMNNFLNNTSRGTTKSPTLDKRFFINNVIKELINSEIIKTYSEENKKDGRKIVDVIFSLYPTNEFIHETKLSNINQSKLRIK